MTRIIDSLADISDTYDAVFCDLWGCVHDGINAFESAVEALRLFKARGGTVLLLTYAPRPRASVAIQLDRIGVPRDCWDVIATSGDSARAAMLSGAVGEKVWHIGEAHDSPFFAPMDLVGDAVDITRVPLEQAEGIVCTGPFDPKADPSDLRPQFLLAKTRGLKLLCANPDIVVDRGDSREWCAGALAQLYTEMGGESLYFGKPHPPIYDLARRRLQEINRPTQDNRILAIGDGILTDIAGAMGEDIDSLFISGGLAAAETKTHTQPDPDALNDYLQTQNYHPTYTIGHLR